MENTKSNTIGRKRDYSVDLFRCILMVMVIVLHSFTYGVDFYHISNYNFVYAVLNSFCIVAVNCFFFISGYFKIKYKPKKILFLIIGCLTYSFIWEFIDSIIHNNSLISVELVKVIGRADMGIKSYWFIVVYVLLCFLAPYLNSLFDKMNKKEGFRFLVIISLINFFVGYLFDQVGIGRGYTLYQGIYMYFVGVYISQNIDWIRKKVKRCHMFFGYVVLSLITAIMSYALYYIIKKGLGVPFYYNNPLVIVSSVLIACVFIGMPFKANRVTTFFSSISKYTLGVYLITGYSIAVTIIFKPMVSLLSHIPNHILRSLVIIAYAVLLFFISIFIEFLRRKLYYFIKNLIGKA